MMLLLSTVAPVALAQTSFDVASIRPSSESVRFESDGETEIAHGTLRMHDVTVRTCIKWAFNLQRAQIIGPDDFGRDHYDIMAKAGPNTTAEQLRPMMQALLAERFGLKFHRDHKEMNAYVLVVSPHGLKMKPSPKQDGEAWHQNSSMGMVARHFTMQDFVTYMSDPLRAPLVDETHLQGQYDFQLDFKPYVDNAPDIHADPIDVLRRAFQGELGLTFDKRRTTVETLVIDHITPPTDN